MSKTTKRIAVGAAVAGLAGYFAGILTAPKSGKATRSDINDVAHRGISQTEKELKKLHTELGGLLEEAKSKGGKVGDKTHQELAELLGKAKDTKEKAREMLSAIHEGSAEDADLQKAIQDANKAIDHIKKYLNN